MGNVGRAFRKAASAFSASMTVKHPSGKEYEVAGKKLTCPYCGCAQFIKVWVPLNILYTPTIDLYICTNCGHMQGFLRPLTKVS